MPPRMAPCPCFGGTARARRTRSDDGHEDACDDDGNNNDGNQGGTARARRTRSDLVCDNDDVLIVDYDDDVNQGGETKPRRNM